MKIIDQYRGLRHENYILSFGRLVTGLGSMVWPMMTLILSRKMGVGAEQISWLLAAGMIIMAPAVYAGGKIADRCNKKTTIIVLDLVSVVSFLICAFIPMSWTSIILLFIGSVGQNMEHPAYTALVADITLTADRDRAFSLQYMCANFGLLLSPTIAGLLFNNYLWVAFLINGISIFSSAVLILFGVRDITPAKEKTEAASYQQDREGVTMMSVMKDSKVVMLFLAIQAGYYTVYQMYVYLMPLDMAAMHGDSGALIYGSVTSINCAVVVLFTPVITRLFGRKPEPFRTTAGVGLFMAGFGIYLIFRTVIPMYYFSMMVLTWGEVFALTAESPYLTRRIPASHRGRINGLAVLIRTLMTSAFQVLIGAVYGNGNSVRAWICVLAFAALFLAAAFLLQRLDRVEYPGLYRSGAEAVFDTEGIITVNGENDR